MSSQDVPMPPFDAPSPARVYAYLLGDRVNSYPVDQQAAEAVLTIAPEMRSLAAENRRFLRHAVQLACDDGVCQFLDLGTGMPTQDNVHEVAQRTDPAARVVYVDNDPTVTAHARAILEDDDQTAYLAADLRDVTSVLEAPETRDLIDPAKPTAVLLVAVLHFVQDADDPAGLVRAYLNAMPPSSFLVLSHVTSTGTDPRVQERIHSVYGKTRNPLQLRTEKEILDLFGGLNLLEPGLVDVAQWPHPTGDEPGPLRVIGAVARKD